MTIWLSIPDVAHLAHIPVRNLYRWVSLEVIASRPARAGRGTEIDLDEAVAYANRGTKLTDPDHGI